ncbi:glycosyltransferase [Microvenator marinus]|uniref:Glycosyltransferase n=1 Tax=Microvenator marinus TaxID=2600177 RepID=A0A5B8XUU1_9DELT|nr:glycosyltransferase [Microvenator marinus]QED28708.1 glycosyltransferase [Microvenator marinus]
MKTIVFAITEFGPGGAETQILRLGQSLVARGWKVHVLSLLEPVGFLEEANAAGIVVSSLKMTRGQPTLRDFQNALEFVRRVKPHALVGFLFHANLLVSLLRLFAGVPRVIISLRGEDYNPRRLMIQRTLLGLRLADVLVTNSKRLSKRLVESGVEGSRIHVVPNLPPPMKHLSSRNLSGAFRWIAVGNILPAKDYANLLHAAKLLESSETPWAIQIAGAFYDAAERRRVEDLIQVLGLEKGVEVLGARSDVEELMHASNGFVLSSREEGLPNALIEAMICGTPVVCTDVGGTGELVSDGLSGMLVSKENSEALATAMNHLMTLDQREREELAKRAYLKVTELCEPEKVIGTWEALIE